ncbi:MAG: RapZ C-terminal domain-containing protein [Nitrososphaerales archaeon]
MERRRKQQAFYTKSSSPVMVNSERELIVYTGGYDSPTSGKIFDAGRIRLDLNLSLNCNALDPELREMIMTQPQMRTFLLGIIRKIEEEDYHTISIICRHGKHRSVALAETLKMHYPKVIVHHQNC